MRAQMAFAVRYFPWDTNLRYPFITLLIAAVKSSSDISFRYSRMALIPASLHTDAISAPEASWQRRASNLKRMPGSTAIRLVCIRKISSRPRRSGSLNSIRRSRRPGRRSASSNVSGRFDAIRTKIFPRSLKPSS